MTRHTSEEANQRPQSVTLKRRGLLAGAAAMTVGLLAKQSAEPVAAVNPPLLLNQNNPSTASTLITASGSPTFGLEVVNTSGAHGLRGIGNVHGVFGSSGQGTGSSGVLGLANHAGAVGIAGIAHAPATQAASFYGRVVVYGDFAVTGKKSAAVQFADGSQRLLYAVESPENWFEDFGKGQLVNGIATVNLDPGFASVVSTDFFHIFLTPFGDSKGLYVAKVSPDGFVVQEQQGGTGASPFSYRIVARRKDILSERFEQVSVAVTPPVPTKP